MTSTRKRFFSSDMHNSFNGFDGNHSLSELPLHFSSSPVRSVPKRAMSASAMGSFFARRGSASAASRQHHFNSDLDYPYDYSSNNSNSNNNHSGSSRSRSNSPILCHSYSSNGNGNGIKQIVAVLGIFSLALLGVAVYQHDLTLQQRLQAKNVELEAFAEHSTSLEQTLSRLRQQTDYLNDKMQQLQQEQPNSPPVDLNTHRKLFHLRHSGQIMQTQIQETSKRLLREKFGKGPQYYVEMKLVFDEDSIAHGGHNIHTDTIVLETAPMDEMPHAVYTFLEQVAHGMYDGTAFYRNAVHKVQAGPVTSENQAKFRQEPSLNSVMFPEYNLNPNHNNPDFSHKAYTLGYPTGGAGGRPDFYINVKDNSYVHGPHGAAARQGSSSTSQDDPADNNNYNTVDPCFARVIRGMDVVDRLHKSETHDTSTMHDVMEHPVLIKSMRIRHDGKRFASSSNEEQQQQQQQQQQTQK